MDSLAVDGFGEVLDEGDLAASHAAQEAAIALAARRRGAAPEAQMTDPETGAVLCRECGRPVPPGRLAVLPMAAFCVPCLELIELRQRLYREAG